MSSFSGDTAAFLQKLRPGGPWVLTAIVPDGPTKTITAHTDDEVVAFVNTNDGTRNIYYGVNPTRTAVSKKAAKTDIAAIEFVLADLDPADGESSEAAKARYRVQLDGTFEPKPTAVIDSGNGIQCLWRLKEPIALQEPTKNDQGKSVFSAADQAAIADVEARVAAVMLRLGAKPGTQNIDRILRLPGTTNLPNARKKKAGRIACPTALINFNGAAYPLSAFPPPERATKGDGPAKGSGGQHSHHRDEGKGEKPLPRSMINMLYLTGPTPAGYDSRSELLFAFINEGRRKGVTDGRIVEACVDQAFAGCSIYEHVSENGGARHVERQIERARQSAAMGGTNKSEEGFETDARGAVDQKSQYNVRHALKLLGVRAEHDMFNDRIEIDGLEGHPHLDDAAVEKLWLTTDERFRLRPALEFFRIVLCDAARSHRFHPVRDYLDRLKWDNTERLDRWLVTHCGAEDTEYVRAVGALTLIAAVRRVRRPGCKYDEMLILEGPQGTLKSELLATLVPQREWFSDDLPLNADSKKVIEQTRGKWIIEAAEMSGMRRTDVEHLKAFLSRQVDRSRMAYGRIPEEVSRQFIVIATTNSIKYLKDPTGNRRYWPVRMGDIDLKKLAAERDQLWAEAATREAKGESIRLARELWPQAAAQQAERTVDDPWLDRIATVLGDLSGKLTAEDAWTIVGMPSERRTQDHNARLGQAMKILGFDHKQLRFGELGRQYSYSRGVDHERDQRIFVHEFDGRVSAAHSEQEAADKTQKAAREAAEAGPL